MSMRKRFWEKVNRGDETECWEWKAAKTDKGYGRFWLNGNQHAHRVAYELEVGELGDQYALHKCDNPACVNPNHLYAGDHSDNITDAHERGQLDFEGDNNPNSSLTGELVKEIKEKLDEGVVQTELANEYGVCQRTISNIKNGNTWSHV